HCAGRGGVPVEMPPPAAPGPELVAAAGWATAEHSAYPPAVHLLLRENIHDLLGRDAISTDIAKLLPHIRQPEGRVDVILARVTLFMSLDLILRHAENALFDRTRALGAILLWGKAW